MTQFTFQSAHLVDPGHSQIRHQRAVLQCPPWHAHRITQQLLEEGLLEGARRAHGPQRGAQQSHIIILDILEQNLECSINQS